MYQRNLFSPVAVRAPFHKISRIREHIPPISPFGLVPTKTLASVELTRKLIMLIKRACPLSTIYELKAASRDSAIILFPKSEVQTRLQQITLRPLCSSDRILSFGVIRKIKLPCFLSSPAPASFLSSSPFVVPIVDWLLQKRERKIYPGRIRGVHACVHACVLIRNNVYHKYVYFDWTDMFPREYANQWLLVGSMI